MTDTYRPRHLSPFITRFRGLRMQAWRVRMWWTCGVAQWQQLGVLIRDGRAPEDLR